MDEIFIVLIVFAVICVLTGPVALIISLIALNRTKEHRYSPSQKKADTFVEYDKPVQTQEFEPSKTEQITPPPLPVVLPQEQSQSSQKMFDSYIRHKKEGDSREIVALEQKIGTLWVLIAGVITVIVGIGFFLKYAYDNALVGPLGRVVITSVAGLIALAAGEITRRRGYGIVAKAVTALGFAILYAAVFSAYRFYQLIGSAPTFILAILVTLAAMLYAVSLDEILIAVISLIGGFLTPVLVSTGENLPIPLFSYVLILSIGAMLCAWYRRWRTVNLIAFAGTFILYTGWFEKFFRQQLAVTAKTPEQMAIALGWLGVFFAIYMTLPLFNGLVKKIKAQKEDVLLVLVNAAVTFCFLWNILYARYRIELAFCAVGLCIAHLVMMSIVIRRCREDLDLRLMLLVIGLFFLTVAIPLYLKMYAIAIAWAAEAVILTIIGLRYRSVWTLVGAAAAFLLSLGQLVNQLPMHAAAFELIRNPAFGSWLFVSIAAVICHILYRKNKWILKDYRNVISQVVYSTASLLLMLTLAMEWFWHCEYNIADKHLGETFCINGFMLLFAIFTLLLTARPLCPAGLFCKGATSIVGFAGAVFAIFGLTESYHSGFVIFANVNFGFAILFVAGIFAAAWFLKQSAQERETDLGFSYTFAIGAILVLWILLSEQIYLYWYCKNKFTTPIANWRFLANMYMSIMWAVYGILLMIAGFWRKIALLRYISLGLFGLLLVKVFILDMGTVKSVYRIAAFLATGVTLVGVSYLYQFLRKRGFFDAILIEEKFED